jgi:hypothetical protein
MSKPAHKNTERPPGQIVNSVDPDLKFAKAQYEHDLDLRPRRLGDIIDRVKRQEEGVIKTFDYEAWRKTLWELIDYYRTHAEHDGQSYRDSIKHHLTLLPNNKNAL